MRNHTVRCTKKEKIVKTIINNILYFILSVYNSRFVHAWGLIIS